MAENKINGMVAGNQTNPMKDYSLSVEGPDGMNANNKTRYTNTHFDEQWSIYTKVTDVQEVIDAKARWVIGKGFKADPQTEILLDSIRGYGKDTFNTIIENMVVIMEIGEDAYTQIITDDEGNLINLKPLNTGRVEIVAGKDGLIDSYEYKNGKTTITIQPKDMLHFPRNRRGDEIHGHSMIDVLKVFIDFKQEMLIDYKKVMHRFVMPQWKFKLKTDDPTEIAAYQAKMDKATAAGDNIYEPFDVSESEMMSLAPNASLNPLSTLQYIDAAFYKAAGVPQFIVGGGTGFTEASEKIAYLAWQQTIEKYQLFIEEQILAQLNLVIELEFPASLENELISDKAKDGPQNIDQSELNPGSENA